MSREGTCLQLSYRNKRKNCHGDFTKKEAQKYPELGAEVYGSEAPRASAGFCASVQEWKANREHLAHVKHEVCASDPGWGLTCTGQGCTISTKAGGHHVQTLLRQNSALDFHADTMRVAQRRLQRKQNHQIHHGKQESGGKGAWESSTPMTGDLAAASLVKQKPSSVGSDDNILSRVTTNAPRRGCSCPCQP